MNINAAAGLSGMLKDGQKHFEGLEGAVLRNIEAAKGIAQITQTSLGPNGMNKLIVNHLEKIFVTSDCATIVKELEVQHPVARMLVMAAEMQENEFGDGTNFTLSFAGELLKLAEDLIRDGLHPAEIVAGYKRAYDKCIELLPQLVVHETPDLRNRDELIKFLKPVLAPKQYGYEDVLAGLVADACLMTFPAAPRKARIAIDNIRVAKLKGGSVTDSQVMRGMVIQRDAEGSVKRAENAKVTVFGCGIEASSTEAKGTVLLRSAEELLNYNRGEEAKMEEAIRSIAETGTKVVIAHGSISEMAMHFIEKYQLMCIKIQSKWDLRRVCSAVGATTIVRLGPATPEEMGFCSLVEVREISGRTVVVFQQEQAEDSRIATIVLRASTDNVLNDLERAVDDGIHTVRAACYDPRFVAGAGAVELELTKQLRTFADSVAGLDQYAIRKFADAFEFVPRTLAENSGVDITNALAALHAAHADNANIGFNIDTNQPHDAVSAGIYDLLSMKANALRLAVDAAITVLRVDQIVMAKPAGGPKPRKPGAPDED